MFNVAHIRCESPRVIYNPKLPAIRSRLRFLHYITLDYSFRGLVKSVSVDDVRVSDIFSQRVFFKASTLFYKSMDCCKSVFDLFRSNIDLYYKYAGYFYFTDSSGEIYPLFIAVPCNHCAICIENKRDLWSYRCQCETEYHMKPVFAATLTYDNAHLPYGDNLSVRDTQLFLKRLRITLERHGYRSRIRYSICGEYGKDRGILNGRPHYHIILWNMPYHELGYLYCRDIIEFCWRNGMVRRCHIVNTSSDKAFKYQCKYLIKPDDVVLSPKYRLGIKSNHHPDRVKPFLHKSCGSLGSIGTPLVRNFVSRNLDLFKRVFNMQKKPQAIFLDPNCKIKFVGNKFVLHQCFKSISQLLPSDFRRACVELITHHDKSTSYLIPFIDKFRELFYIPSPSVKLNEYKYTISDSALIVRKFLARYGLLHPEYIDAYIKDIKEKIVFRDSFLQSNMFSDEFDLFKLSYNCRNSLAYAKNLEVL